MHKFLNNFLKSVLAGIFISVALIVYINNKTVLDVIVFSVGVISILKLKLNLFTGMVGYEENYLKLIISLAGNFLGTYVSSLLLIGKITNFIDLETIIQNKVSQNLFSVFISSIVCGMLVYTAIYSYKKDKDIISVILCISAFVMFNADHCVANSFYFFVSRNFDNKTILYNLFCILGNYIGSKLCSFTQKI
ncbi:MAG: formate/nitrite transporter family protein [Candidatus Paraimprobicoccus trichonymphae]|uniref:Formate/nitrite transporter family protein n=1 Tax=Candidatus Paraimprobicoccus trichonymphae TaxID=3033793 RepID=A0AA48KZ97_9FIRM|nr:MAG: formate/nitrite transporter family protein [Candidatus Paraimprobicoccus trichonymphae]